MSNIKKEINPRAIALDTGGTMSDSFIIDDRGEFSVGKAVTTPEDESRGIINSINDCLAPWNISLSAVGGGVGALVYSGTAMLNRLLEREGDGNIGVIVNKGFEDLPRLGRKTKCRIRVRDTEEDIRELYPKYMGCDPEWEELREFYCPGCFTLLDTETVPPGYPVVFNFLPDIDTFYEKWIGRSPPDR